MLNSWLTYFKWLRVEIFIKIGHFDFLQENQINKECAYFCVDCKIACRFIDELCQNNPNNMFMTLYWLDNAI